MGRKMFGLINRYLHQVTGKLDVKFGDILIILVADFAQLPPVTDNTPCLSTPVRTPQLTGENVKFSKLFRGET